MAHRFVILSGPICGGKTALAAGLSERFGAKVFKTKTFIQERFKDDSADRGELQNHGDLLDERTKGKWVLDGVSRFTKGVSEDDIVLIDSVRIKAQVEHIRRAYGPRVVHIHVTADESTLRKRFKKRKRNADRATTYDQARGNATEAQVGVLKAAADVVVYTDRCTAEDVVVRAASHLGLFERGRSRLVDVVVGGQYGSEGKGHVCSYLAPEYQVLVRVGGPNAGHKVFRHPEPFTHRLLPSGTRFGSADLVIGAGAVIDIDTLLEEIADCEVPADRLIVDEQAMIIEKVDLRSEARLEKDIGSTRRGVGAATARRIMGRGASSGARRVRLAKDVPELRPFIGSACSSLEDALRDGKKILLEGTQGTGLSIFHGSYPHVTSRDTSVAGCLAEAGVAPSRVRRVVLVCRSYPIRVKSPEGSSSGPMSQDVSWAEISRRSGISVRQLTKNEKGSVSGKQRRVAEFDWALLRKSASLNGPTDVAITFADYLSESNTEARRLEQLTDETLRFIQEVERVAAAPVSLVSTRFHWRSFIDRRAW